MSRATNLGYYFANSVTRFPDKVALIDLHGGVERRVTYAQLDERADRILEATGLRLAIASAKKKRNFQVMPGAEWLELLRRHIPDRYEHLVRYVGWYSNRARGERAKVLKAQAPATKSPTQPERVSEFATRAKAAWARLIRKVYEADPLECPKCKGPMRIIALIEDPAVVRRILEHLGRWAPEATERGPPTARIEWPANAVLPLTYHPLPDIA